MNNIRDIAIALYFAKAYMDSNPEVGMNFGMYQEILALKKIVHTLGMKISDQDIQLAMLYMRKNGLIH